LGLQLVREWMGPGVRGCLRLRGWFRLLGLTAQGGLPSTPWRGHQMGVLAELCRPGGCGTPDVVGVGPHRAVCTIRDQGLIVLVVDSGHRSRVRRGLGIAETDPRQGAVGLQAEPHVSRLNISASFAASSRRAGRRRSAGWRRAWEEASQGAAIQVY